MINEEAEYCNTPPLYDKWLHDYYWGVKENASAFTSVFRF